MVPDLFNNGEAGLNVAHVSGLFECRRRLLLRTGCLAGLPASKMRACPGHYEDNESTIGRRPS